MHFSGKGLIKNLYNKRYAFFKNEYRQPLPYTGPSTDFLSELPKIWFGLKFLGDSLGAAPKEDQTDDPN